MSSDNFLRELHQLYTQPVVMREPLLEAADLKRGLTQIEASWVAGRAVYPAVNFQTFAREGYAGNILAYACVHRLAQSGAEAIPRAYVLDSMGRREWLPESHPLNKLLRQPNPNLSSYDWVESMFAMLNIAGNSYWEKERSRVGRVVALWHMRPDRTQPVPDLFGQISAYKYTVGSQSVFVPARNVLHIRYFHPVNDYEGLSPMQVAAKRIDVDTLSTDYTRAFFDNRSVPASLLIVKKKLLQAEAERLKAEWKARFSRNFHDVAVIDQDMTFQPVGVNNRDADLSGINLESQSQICAVFGVPPILVGLRVGLENSPWSNVGEARRSFWEDTLVPQLRRLEEVLTVGLAREFGDDLFIGFDTSNVVALRENKSQMHEIAARGVSAGYLTINDARRLAGMDPLPEGDVFLWPLNMQVVPVESEYRRNVLEESGSTQKVADLSGVRTENWLGLSEYFDKLRLIQARWGTELGERGTRVVPTNGRVLEH